MEAVSVSGWKSFSLHNPLLIKANLIEPLVGLFNFRFLSGGFSCPFPGLTVVSKQFFSATHVFCTMLVICILYVLHWLIQRLRSQGAPSLGPYVGGILQTLLLGYKTLASVSFTLLRCVPIGTDRCLFYDGNVVCFQWWQYLLIAFVCIFMIPFVFELLWGSYKLYGGTLSVGKFLLAWALPLPSSICRSFLSLFGKIRNPVVDDPSPHQGTRNPVEMILYSSFTRPEDGKILSLSWESVMIGRRLILITLKAFVSDPLLRLLIMTLFAVVSSSPRLESAISWCYCQHSRNHFFAVYCCPGVVKCVFQLHLFCLWRFHLPIISAPGGMSVKWWKSPSSVSYLGH